MFQRLTSVQRGLTTPEIGQMVYDTDLNLMYYGDGANWNQIGTGSIIPASSIFYSFIPITGTTDESGLLLKTQTGIGSVTGTYTITNFTGATEFNTSRLQGIYIRCRVRQIGTAAQNATVTCTYPDGSTKTILKSFNTVTVTEEGTGIEETVLIPINSATVSVTIVASCSAINCSAYYEVIGALQYATTTVTINLPSGVIIPYPNATPPTGWLACDGSIVNIAAYPDLYAILGITYGGDGATTFGLPDLIGRFPVGENPISGPSGNGRLPPGTLRGTVALGGYKTQLDLTQIPYHNHGFSSDPRFSSGHDAGKEGTGYWTGYTGGDQYHNTVPCYQVFTYIIKT